MAATPAPVMLTRTSPEWKTLIELTERCLLPALPTPVDELHTDFNKEYATFFSSVEKHIFQLAESIPPLLNRIKHDAMDLNFITTFVHLLYEMDPDTPWTRHKGYSEHCDLLHNNLAEAFKLDLRIQFPSGKFYEQLASDIFILSMEKLHKQITKDLWKFHPGSTYCFRAMSVSWTELHKIRCPWPLIFPGIFIQIDDHDEENVLDGLNCCLSVLKNVKYIDNEQNGYETVIFDVLAKHSQFREASIMIGTLECLLLLLPKMGVLKLQSKWTQMDDVLDLMLDGLGLENIKDKKKIYLIYIRKLMKMNANTAIRFKKKITSIVLHDIQMILGGNEVIYDDLIEYLNCLEAWLQIGWPIWVYSMDKELIFLMFKIICHHQDCKDNDAEVRCLVLMLSLCDDHQRRELLNEDYAKVMGFDKNFQIIWSYVMGRIKYDAKSGK